MDKTPVHESSFETDNALRRRVLGHAEAPDDDAAETNLKRRLLSRIAAAAVVMVGLLGSLAIFDSLYAPQHQVATKMAAMSSPHTGPDAPPPVAAPAREEPVAAEPKPAEPAAETKPEATAATKVETPAVPERTAAPEAPPLQPLPAEKPLTKPASGRPASIRPSGPALAPLAPIARPDPQRELAPAQTAPRRAPASRPITQAGERQYALQMGVFSNLANAEDLRAKLELHGIPSSIEARVHVGPFASREEAEAARIKLKELGLDGGLLLTMKPTVSRK